LFQPLDTQPGNRCLTKEESPHANKALMSPRQASQSQTALSHSAAPTVGISTDSEYHFVMAVAQMLQDVPRVQRVLIKSAIFSVIANSL